MHTIDVCGLFKMAYILCIVSTNTYHSKNINAFCVLRNIQQDQNYIHTYYAQFCNTYIYNFQASPGHRAKAYSCFSTLHKNLKPCGQEDDNFVQCQLCVQVTGCCLNEWRLQSIFFDPAFCSVWPVVLWNKAPNFVKILPKLEPYIRTFAQRNFRSKFGNFKTKRSTNLELIQANFGRLKK
jgi:hypothetical protein